MKGFELDMVDILGLLTVVVVIFFGAMGLWN